MRPAVGDGTGIDFDSFALDAGRRLRHALVARYGVDVGCDVTADALAHAWQHWGRIQTMANPVGYLFRVAQSAGRRHHRWRRGDPFPPEPPAEPPEQLDIGLHRALTRLGADQRTCVVLVHVFGWSYAETATVLDTTTGAVRNHVHRGLNRLRTLLEEHP